MKDTTRIHSLGDSGFVEFRAGLGHRRPTATRTPVEVAVIGYTGQVGSALLSGLARRQGLPGGPDLVFREGINRNRHLIADQRESRERRRDAATLAALGTRLISLGRPAVIVDCTADPELPRHYPGWLRAGIGVVTPNKYGFSGEPSLYHAIRESARIGRAPLGYSATVGAGLPILATLRRLRGAGLPLAGLTAVVSGTLAHVFNRMATGRALSDAVSDAARLGFTEPNPLEDLSGRDVERKLAIMLREIGLEAIEIAREPVIPDRKADPRDANAVMREHDDVWLRRVVDARAAGCVWAYVAEFVDGAARCAPAMVRATGGFAQLAGSENLVRIEYAGEGLAALDIRGPGAGAGTTAGAVLADVVDAAVQLQARH